MPSWWVMMSTATYREAHVSQSEYLGVVSSVGFEVRQVVTHRNSLDFLPLMGEGRKGALRRSAASLGVRWRGGVPAACPNRMGHRGPKMRDFLV